MPPSHPVVMSVSQIIVRYVYVMEIMDVMNVNALWSVPIAFYQPFTQIVLKCGIQLTPYPYRSLCASICIFLTLNHHSDSNSNLKNVLTEDEIFSIKYKIKCKRRLTFVFKYRVSPQKMSVYKKAIQDVKGHFFWDSWYIKT